jgi:hypothetical protein
VLIAGETGRPLVGTACPRGAVDGTAVAVARAPGAAGGLGLVNDGRERRGGHGGHL